MRPAHLARRRPAQRRAAAPDEVTAPAYAPGYFTALVRQHDWPPQFAPQWQRTREVEQSEISRINRERRQAQGDPGTIVGLSVKSETARLMRRLAARGR